MLAQPFLEELHESLVNMDTIKFLRYENKLLILLSFIFGFVLFDRMALSFLVPFFDKELGLNNTQIGLLSSMLALAWAISGYLMGTLSDKTGKRKQYLITAVVIFSVCSFISGLSTSFSFLLMARVIMGVAEGPVLPLAQSIMIDASSEKRRGFNIGFMEGLVGNIFAMLAPIVLVALATKFSWRSTFFIAGIPGLILAAFGLFYIKETTPIIAKEIKSKTSILFLLKHRNIWVSVLLSSCIMTWLAAQVTFMPKYLISIKGLSEADMGKIMSGFGLGAIIWGIVGPAISDKLGRKPVTIIFIFLSAFAPLSVVYFGNNISSLLTFVLLGTSIMGVLPLVLGIIPSESIPRQNIAKTLGLVIGAGEIVGGFILPTIAGWLADRFGLHTPFLVASGAAFCASVIACFLYETVPSRVNKNKEQDPLAKGANYKK